MEMGLGDQEEVEGAEQVEVSMDLERATSLCRVVPIIHDDDDNDEGENETRKFYQQEQGQGQGQGHGQPFLSLAHLFQLHNINNTNSHKDIATLTGDEEDQHQHHHRRRLPNVSGIPVDDWLPITQSRKGNSFTAAFHLMCSGMGIQSLAVPVAFISLGWVWGSVCLSLVFGWQLYTTWLLLHLHQPLPSHSKNHYVTGPRYSRYVLLSIIAFGPKLGKLLAIFPTMYLSGGTCVLFIITGGGIMELLSKLFSPHTTSFLTGAECFLVFVCVAILVSQFFPTLDSLAPVSLLGSVSAVLYFSLLWTLSITQPGTTPPPTQQSNSSESETLMATIRGIIDAIGIIALTFRGHNLVLEIQGTMPTNPQRPARNLMWKGVTASYVGIGSCIFPLAIGGYWAYGNSLMGKAGILDAFVEFHKTSSKWILGAIYLTMLLHLLCAFQLYGMPALDNLERIYVSKKNQACPMWLRSAIRLFFGGLTYFIALAFPFLGSLGPFVGAITLPLTLAYPCFMWIAIEKPKKGSNPWCLNLGLGCLGILLSLLLAAAALWNLVAYGLDANFFKPH